jgi:hypothetical protein
MYPLDNRRLAAKNSDRKAFFGDEEQVLRQYLKECGYTKSPATLGEYLQKEWTRRSIATSAGALSR